MADENKPTPQQSQDAVQLDSLTSLQQTTEGDQGGISATTEVRADATPAPANSSPQDGPSFYLPNTDLTNAPPAQTDGAPTSNSDTEDETRLFKTRRRLRAHCLAKVCWVSRL